MVLIAVGENDLQSVLNQNPITWRNKLCLLQNELLPKDLQGIDDPTVISVWFEKKPGMEVKIIIPSPIYGPKSELLSKALATLNIPTRVLTSSIELLFELVLKNVYILTSNIAGLRTGGTVEELWRDHQAFAHNIAHEVIAIQAALTDSTLDAESLIQGMLKAFDGDPEHKCMGRSAPARLNRALQHAEQFHLSVPLMRQLQTEQAAS